MVAGCSKSWTVLVWLHLPEVLYQLLPQLAFPPHSGMAAETSYTVTRGHNAGRKGDLSPEPLIGLMLTSHLIGQNYIQCLDLWKHLDPS